MFLINFIANQKYNLLSYVSGRYCFIRPFKLSFTKVLFISLVLVCSSCGGRHIEKTNVYDLSESFKKGTIELSWAGVGGYKNYRIKMRKFYAEKNWEFLSKTVIEADRGQNIDWYYLGRSAEGLGLYKAAKVYYTNALSTLHALKCDDSVSDLGCDGINFPQDIIVRLSALRSYQSTPR